MLQWKGPVTYHQSSILFKTFLKIIALVYIYQLAKFGHLTSCGSKAIFKLAPFLINNTHHDATDLVNHGMVKNTTRNAMRWTIAMICSTLASLGKLQYFWRPMYNPVKHLWSSFYCENSKPLSIFSEKLHRRYSFGF